MGRRIHEMRSAEAGLGRRSQKVAVKILKVSGSPAGAHAKDGHQNSPILGRNDQS